MKMAIFWVVMAILTVGSAISAVYFSGFTVIRDWKYQGWSERLLLMFILAILWSVPVVCVLVMLGLLQANGRPVTVPLISPIFF